MGTGGWHWWLKVGGTGGLRWVALLGTGRWHFWAQVVTLLCGTGGGTAGHRWAELVCGTAGQ
ncbi:unnamed protein product [Staurois parvus]|uniref:Uncharacterized protein n=1 Tax=Staurois parvus TaxID=386267 RepID=A0ABN9HMB6_9NEOB|nr:unnamed protein product [Staurois parvus]